eukprot:jgi/Bigna1/78625/fgenesh1_pg.56_\
MNRVARQQERPGGHHPHTAVRKHSGGRLPVGLRAQIAQDKAAVPVVYGGGSGANNSWVPCRRAHRCSDSVEGALLLPPPLREAAPPSEGCGAVSQGGAKERRGVSAADSIARRRDHPPPFHSPFGICFDPNGNVFVGDEENNAVRMISSQGDVRTIVGLREAQRAADERNLSGSYGKRVSHLSPEEEAARNNPSLLSEEAYNNIRESFGYLINDVREKSLVNGPRGISPDGEVTTIAGHPKFKGANDGVIEGATFNAPTGVDIHPRDGSIVVADKGNHRIRQYVTLASIDMIAEQQQQQQIHFHKTTS